MNAAEIFGIFGIFVIIWWIGRRVAQAFDRYELMKEQRENDGNGRRNAVVGRPRNADMLHASARPRQRALR